MRRRTRPSPSPSPTRSSSPSASARRRDATTWTPCATWHPSASSCPCAAPRPSCCPSCGPSCDPSTFSWTRCRRASAWDRETTCSSDAPPPPARGAPRAGARGTHDSAQPRCSTPRRAAGGSPPCRPAHPRVTRDRITGAARRSVEIFLAHRCGEHFSRRARCPADLPRTARELERGALLPLSKLRVSLSHLLSPYPACLALASLYSSLLRASDFGREPNPEPTAAACGLVGASALFRAASAAYAARTRALDTSLVALATSPPARATAETDALSPAAASAAVGTSSKDSNPPNLANSVHTSDDTGTTVDGLASARRASISRRTARRFSRSLAPFAGRSERRNRRDSNRSSEDEDPSSSSSSPSDSESDRVANRDRPARLVRLTIAAARARAAAIVAGLRARWSPATDPPRPETHVRGAGEASGEEDEDVDGEDDVSVPRAASFVVDDAGRPPGEPEARGAGRSGRLSSTFAETFSAETFSVRPSSPSRESLVPRFAAA